MPEDTEPMLKWFEFSHLPAGKIRDTSANFGTLAGRIVEELPRSAERTVALRKLLEAKDAAVRCAVDVARGDGVVGQERAEVDSPSLAAEPQPTCEICGSYPSIPCDGKVHAAHFLARQEG